MIQRKKSYSIKNGKETEDLMKREKNNKYLTYIGLVLTILSGALFSFNGIIVKHISHLPPELLAVYRFVGIFAFSLPEAVKSGEDLLGPQGLRLLLVVRGFFVAGHTLFCFFAFRYLPLGEASVIIFSVPIFVTIAARVFLKEPVGLVQILAILLTVVGIILTTRLPLQFSKTGVAYTKNTIIGFLAASGSLVTNTGNYIITRKLKGTHHSILLSSSGCIALIVSLCFTILMGSCQWHNCGIEKLYIILLGVVSYLGQTSLTLALQLEHAATVSTTRAATDIILGFVWQTFLFFDTPDIFSISGAVLVSFSVVLIGLKKWVSTLPPESPYFKKLKWMAA